MHRVTSGRPAIPSNVLYTARSFSTPPPRKPLAKWGDVVIPSREEISERKAKVQTDISYLKFENANSLAARLARPTIDITLARQQAEQKRKEERAQAQSPSGNVDGTAVGKTSPKVNRTIILKSPQLASPNPNRAFSVEDIITKSNAQRQVGVSEKEADQTPVDAAQLEAVGVLTHEYSDNQMADIMIAKRREARLLREAMRRSLKEKQEEERAEKQRQDEERRIKRKANATHELESCETQLTPPVNTSSRSLAERAAEIMRLASESAQKRREERLKREVDSATVSQNMERAASRTKSKRTAMQSKDEDMEVEMIEEASSVNIGPEFVGPEPVSTTLFELYQPAAKAFATIAQLQAGHIQKGDYSAYVPSSLAPFSTPPGVLGAPRLAELTLSHRRDVSLASRKHTVHLVASSLKPATRSLQKSV